MLLKANFCVDSCCGFEGHDTVYSDRPSHYQTKLCLNYNPTTFIFTALSLKLTLNIQFQCPKITLQSNIRPTQTIWNACDGYLREIFRTSYRDVWLYTPEVIINQFLTTSQPLPFIVSIMEPISGKKIERNVGDRCYYKKKSVILNISMQQAMFLLTRTPVTLLRFQFEKYKSRKPLYFWLSPQH
jgi:hypothetical protein